MFGLASHLLATPNIREPQARRTAGFFFASTIHFVPARVHPLGVLLPQGSD